jgi:hypothetical protein
MSRSTAPARWSTLTPFRWAIHLAMEYGRMLGGRSPAGTAPAVVLSSEAGVLHASSRRGDADCAEEDDRVPDVACGRYALIGLFAPPTCDQFVTAQV